MSGQAHSVVFVSRNRQHDVFKTVCSTCSGQVYSGFFFSSCVCVCLCVCVCVCVCVCKIRQHDLFNTVCSTCSGQVHSVFFFVCLKVESMTYLTMCVERAVVRFILCFCV